MLIYVDDVVVMVKSEENALENPRQVFQRFKDANLKLKAAKCNLFQKEVAFLGHVVSEEGIKCDPGKVESVRNQPEPTCVTEVRSFLGLGSYNRKFLDGFPEKACPLTKLTKKEQSFVWDPEC